MYPGEKMIQRCARFYKLYLLTQPLICFSHDGRFLNTLLQYWQNTSSCWQCLTKTCLLRFCLLLFSLLAADINSHCLQLHPFSVFTMNSNAAEKMNIHTLALYKLYEIKIPFTSIYYIEYKYHRTLPSSDWP